MASFFERIANSFSSFFVFIELVMKIRKSIKNTMQYEERTYDKCSLEFMKFEKFFIILFD